MNIHSQIPSRISCSAHSEKAPIIQEPFEAPALKEKEEQFENTPLKAITISGVQAYTNLPLTEEISSILHETANQVIRNKEEHPDAHVEEVIYLTRINDDLSSPIKAKLEIRTIPEPVEHLRRITGYLVGTLDKFNDAKRAEEKDRVKHI